MSFLHFFSSLPTGLMTFLVIFLYLIFTLIAFTVCNRFISNQHRDNHTNLVITVSQSVGTLYGLLLASIAVLIITNRMDISHAIETEANSVADIALLSALLPQHAEEIQENLRSYLLAVKDIEIPALKEGKTNYAAGQYLMHLQRMLLIYPSPTSTETMAIQKGLDVLTDLYKARRTRLEEAQYHTHPYVWFILISGSVLLIISCAIFTMRHRPLYLFLLSLLGLSVGLIISLLIAFDKPFVGSLAIQPIALEESLKLIESLSNNVPLSQERF